MRPGVIALLVLLLVSGAAFAAAPGVYAITNGTVHPVSGPAMTNGTVVIRDGLIEAVGANVTIPADATVIDARGGHVYPGFIDAYTSFGVTVDDKKKRDLTAANLSVDFVAPTDDDLETKRATGVTTIVAAPTSAIFNGQSVVMNLGAGPNESRVIRSRAGVNVAFNTRGQRQYPGSLMGVIAYVRQTMLDAQQHSAALAVYEKTPAGLQRPTNNPALEALAPVIRREVPLVFAADSENAIRRAQAIAREFNVRLVVAGGRQAYSVANELRDVPVLVSVKWPVAPAAQEDREEQPLRVVRDRVLAPTTPSVLAKNNVQFALVSGSGKSGDFIPGIRKAMQNGLTADDAVRAVTLAPARIFGVDRQLGSLERGKIANVVISDGPVFSEGSKITRVLIDGREVRLAAETKKSEKSSDADQAWAFNIRTPQGDVSMNVSLRIEEGRVTGTFSGDRGSGEIRSGTFANNMLEFTISAQVEAETSDWVFRGTVRENSIEGSVATSGGTFQFSGSKPK